MSTHFEHIVNPAGPILLDRSKSTAQYFEEGNYTTAAMLGQDHEWQKWAAMSLIGLPDQGLSGLLQFPSTDHIRFYQAIACFMMRAEREAIQILESVPTQHAQNLLRLLRKPQIHVLAQLPWLDQPATNLKQFMPEDPRFSVLSIGREHKDLSETPYMNVLDYVSEDTPPDFYLAMMVEFHHLPVNLHVLECPLIGHTADFDIHYQCVRPMLKCFDELVVNDGTEWQHLSALTDRPVTTMPKSFGILPNMEPLTNTQRSVDVAQTGTLFHPYHYDKARFVIELLKSSDTTGYYINDFPLSRYYREILSRSKMTLVYARHGGCMPTRGIEALSMGCIPLVHRDNSLQLYIKESEGLVTYDYTPGQITETVQRVTQEWESTYAERALRGAQLVREQFSLPLVASQYLRYMTVLAARPRKKTRNVMPQNLVLKRPVLYKGWIPNPKLIRHHHTISLRRLASIQKLDQDGNTYNIWLRETAFGLMLQTSKLGDPQLHVSTLSQVMDACHGVLGQFPRALVLRFNLARIPCFQGLPAEVTRGLELIDQILETPETYWQVKPEDDVLAWDYSPETFNYRAYLDHVSLVDCGAVESQAQLPRLIYASLYHLRGLYTGSVEDHRAAMRLDPDFPYYALACARELARIPEAWAVADAISLLETLAESTVVAVQAAEEIRDLALLKRGTSAKFDELMNRYFPHDRKFTQGNVPTVFELKRCLHRRAPLQAPLQAPASPPASQQD